MDDFDDSDISDKRHSSPSRMDAIPRPRTHRKRSSSFPVIDALGCSTPEAELLLAEGRAAVRSRQASRHGRRRRLKGDIEPFRPKDHLKYLYGGSTVSDDVDVESISTGNTNSPSRYRHSRMPSNATDTSSSTIVAPVQPPVDRDHTASTPVGRPLGDYSANLAEFIRSQLNSIPSYKTTQSNISPCSCPDLTFARSPPQSPTKSIRRPVDAPRVIDIPLIRPPLKSAFSEWSSTDDESQLEDEVPPLPSAESASKDSKRSNYTPSMLDYYENSTDSSFLFPATPLEEDDQPDTAKGFSFPSQAELPGSSADPDSPAQHDDDYPSSALSARPQLSPSSAPSFSSTSTGSYFDLKRPISLVPHIRDRIIAAVTPPLGHGKIITATSPFEDGAIANVHDVLIESQQRVQVDGMSFDMVCNFTTPSEGLRRVQTPC